ncbi:MAG: hypothetical protein RL616_2135 [Verrucomicrobiota bacterium]
MIFNGGMSIWILALLVVAATTLAGWRQGGIRAAVGFAGIFIATLFAPLVGKLFHVLLPFLGATNPVTVWALSPVCGFIVVSIIFSVIAFNVHRKVDVYYKYKAGDLRLALWTRLNSRLGICVGVLNGVIYFILISFLLFNLTYWTTQATAGVAQPSMVVRLVNSLGQGLQTTGFARTSASVGTLPPLFYKYADLSGFLMQNPQTGPRLAEYPALASLWEQADMQGLVTDTALTGALAAGTSLGEIMNLPSVQDFLKNKELSKRVTGIVETNLDDIAVYLQTGKSAKFDGEKILGRWQFNASVTLAWFRQSQPKIQVKEMASIRALWSAAYAQMTLHLTSDNLVFVKNYPHFQQSVPPFIAENWNGDWSREGETYTIHLTLNGADKFVTATTPDGLRLSVKDGRNLLIFDRVD